jgi:hypothetical protein
MGEFYDESLAMKIAIDVEQRKVRGSLDRSCHSPTAIFQLGIIIDSFSRTQRPEVNELSYHVTWLGRVRRDVTGKTCLGQRG